MINSNRFCLVMLLLTLLFIIIGIFLVVSSLQYSVDNDQEREVVSRRNVRNDEPLHSTVMEEEALRRDVRDKGASQKEPYPVFPEDYHASGLLILPHSAIAEPFEIWYSNTLGASRIDYYYGIPQFILLPIYASIIPPFCNSIQAGRIHETEFLINADNQLAICSCVYAGVCVELFQLMWAFVSYRWIRPLSTIAVLPHEPSRTDS